MMTTRTAAGPSTKITVTASGIAPKMPMTTKRQIRTPPSSPRVTMETKRTKKKISLAEALRAADGAGQKGLERSRIQRRAPVAAEAAG
jgi:hypothetical protein